VVGNLNVEGCNVDACAYCAVPMERGSIFRLCSAVWGVCEVCMRLDSLLLVQVTCPGEVSGGPEHLVADDGGLPVGGGQPLLAHGCCLLKKLPKASGVMR
jgi:hypothetical protein